MDPRVHTLLQRREDLLRRRRGMVLPGIGLGVGIATMITGGAVFAAAWSGSDDINWTQDTTGLVLMPVGAAITLASTVVLVVHGIRRGRLRRAEDRLRLWNVPLDVAPTASAHGAGLLAIGRF